MGSDFVPPTATGSGSTVLLYDTQEDIDPRPAMPGRPNRTTFTVKTDSTDNVVQQFATSSQQNPSSYAQTQNALYLAGFYGSSKPKYGVYGTKDKSAMADALKRYGEVAVQNPGMTLSQFLSSNGQALAANGGPGPTRAPLTISYTDPETLKATLNSAAENALGRGLTKHELDAFVGAFHAKEAAYQKGAYNNDKSVTNPDYQGEAQSYIQSHNAVEAKQAASAGYLDQISRMLGAVPG